MKDGIPKALEKALQVTVEAKAKEELYSRGDTGDSGELARSIYTSVSGNEGIVASPLESAYWVEYGTGSYAIHGDGRPGWWIYIDEDYPHPKQQRRIIYSERQAHYVAHLMSLPEDEGGYGIPADKIHVTKGTPANPFLRPALENNIDELNKVFGEELLRYIYDVR